MSWPTIDFHSRIRSSQDEAGSQQALDASGLNRLSSDGAVLARVVAGSLGNGPLDLPRADGPRLWRAGDIEALLPLLKDFAPSARLLAKAGAWDEFEASALARGIGRSSSRPFNRGEGGANVDGQPTAKKPTPPHPPPRPPGIAPDIFADANVNVTDDRENRGNIINAVVARLRVTDPNAKAPIWRGEQQSNLRRKQHGRAWRGAKKLAA